LKLAISNKNILNCGTYNYVCATYYIYRYSITYEWGWEHLILGKVSSISVLAEEEMGLVERYNINHSTVKLYHCVIYTKVLYTSSYNKHSEVKNDSVLLLKQNQQSFLGVAKHYLSFCSTNCTTCAKPCKHVPIIQPYNIIPDQIGKDHLTGATATQVFHVCSTRFELLCIISSDIHILFF